MAGQAIAEHELTLADFDFELPPELIAQHPLADRCASRLLHVAPTALRDLHFADIEQLLGPDDLLVATGSFYLAGIARSVLRGWSRAEAK